MTQLHPGVYPAVPMAEYLAWPRYSRSWLAGLVAGDSPRVVKHNNAGGGERVETAAQSFGTAFHLLVFEPVAALDRIAVAPPADRRTKDGKKAWSEFTAQNWGKRLVKADDWAAMQGMAENLAADPVASEYLAGMIDREVSFVWEEPTVQAIHPHTWMLPLKCRVDGLDPDAQRIIDLKTTGKDLRRHTLARSSETYGYALQAALYPRGLAAHGMEGFDVVNVWASTAPPYDVAVTRLTDESLQAAIAATDWALTYLARLDASYGDAHPWPGPCAETAEPLDLHTSRLGPEIRTGGDMMPERAGPPGRPGPRPSPMSDDAGAGFGGGQGESPDWGGGTFAGRVAGAGDGTDTGIGWGWGDGFGFGAGTGTGIGHGAGTGTSSGEGEGAGFGSGDSIGEACGAGSGAGFGSHE